MASVASQLVEEVTAHAQSNSLEDAREICADGTYFPNNLRTTRNGNKFKKYAPLYLTEHTSTFLLQAFLRSNFSIYSFTHFTPIFWLERCCHCLELYRIES